MQQSRNAIAAPVCVLLLLTATLSTSAARAEMTVTLLGTGDPQPALDRFGPSTVIQAGPHSFVFDVGRGATQRLRAAKIPFDAITAVFLTHLHSDHVVGLPDLWLTGWLVSNRATPLRLHGPRGTAAMAAHLESAFAVDVGIRVSDNKSPVAGGRLIGRDASPGVVFDRDGVRVEAFEVDHGMLRPSYGYRIEYRGRSVVLSGDTRRSDNLIAHAKNADVLIHNVAFAPPAELRASKALRSIIARLATPEEAAEVFRQTRPRVAVFTHVVLFGGATEEDVMRAASERYAGRLYMGDDGMRIEIGRDVVITSGRELEGRH